MDFGIILGAVGDGEAYYTTVQLRVLLPPGEAVGGGDASDFNLPYLHTTGGRRADYPVTEAALTDSLDPIADFYCQYQEGSEPAMA